MRKLLLLVILGTVFYPLQAQNLVVNPSFETNTGCPTTSSQVTRATPWQAAKNSPEYMHTCGGNQYCVLPTNFWGNEPASAGNACMGGLFYGSFASSYLPDLREFLYGNLTTPLVAGQTYYVSFKANLADLSSHACNNLGVQFTSSYNSNFPLNNMAHVYTTSVVNQTAGYATISGTFVPSSNFTNVMIGNFFTDANTTVISVRSPTIGWNAYYFIDEICVSPTPGACFTILAAKWGDIEAVALPGMKVNLSWNTLSEKNTDHFEVERSLDGTNFTRIANQKAAGNSSKSLNYNLQDKPNYYGRIFYRVRLIDENGSTHTSKTVEVLLDESLTDFFQASPNPLNKNELLSVYLDREIDGKVDFDWLDGAGRIVRHESRIVSEGNGIQEFDLNGLSAGVYRMRVSTSSRSRTQPLVLLD